MSKIKDNIKKHTGTAAWIAFFVSILLIAFVISNAVEEQTKIKEPLDRTYIESVFQNEMSHLDKSKDILFKESFIGGCEKSVGNTFRAKNYCGCTYTYLTNRIGLDGLVTLSNNLLNNTINQKEVDLMVDAVLNCQHLF